MYRLVARFNPRFTLLFPVWLYFVRSLVIVPILSLMLQGIDLGVASSGNRQYSPRYQSSVLRVFSRLWPFGCDETIPQCVLSLHGKLDFGWGVLRSGSHSRWSVLDGLVIFSPRSWPTDDAAIRLLLLHVMLLCTRPLWWTGPSTVEV